MLQNDSSNPSPSSNFIQTFLESASNAGFQKSNRYIVYVLGPNEKVISDQSIYKEPSPVESSRLTDSDLTNKSIMAGRYNILGNSQYSKLTGVDASRRLAINCTNAILGGKSISTQEFGAIGSGPVTKFPYAETFTNEFTLQFNCGSDFFERSYFTKWLNNVVDPTTHDVNLYSDYAKPWKVLVVMLPQDVSDFNSIDKFRNEGDGSAEYDQIVGDDGVRRNVFYLRFQEVYPVEIMESPISYDENSILKISVKFNYRYWDDPVLTYMNAARFRHDNNLTPAESPFNQFRRIMRDVARYVSDPAAARQALIEKGLGGLGDIIGIENVEKIAQGGQIVDVYNKSPIKNTQTIQKKLIGPLGRVIF